jgi:prevent-host-death family protein
MPAPVSATQVRPRSRSAAAVTTSGVVTLTQETYPKGGVYARILYMTTVPLADARAHLSKLVDEAVRTHERVEITRNGQRAAILMSADDFDAHGGNTRHIGRR